MTVTPHNFDWLNAPIYEPAPTIERTREPIPFGYRVFLVIAVLVVVGGGLAGLVL